MLSYVSSKFTGELCICMELMDTTVEKFYRAMHLLGEVASNDLDRFLRRLTHNVRLLSHSFLVARIFLHRLFSDLTFWQLKELFIEI